jgi:hypothetical protein
MLVDTRALPKRVVYRRRTLRLLALGSGVLLLLTALPGLFSSDPRRLAIAVPAVAVMSWLLWTMRSVYLMVADRNGVRACRLWQRELRLPWSEIHGFAIVPKRTVWGRGLSAVAIERPGGAQVLLTQVTQFAAPESASILRVLIESMEQVRREANR